ncbi:MAG: hypothetical protein HY791_10625 [Deltaproteobacteria bacterium]|nr:hypothetical protein [Deltaproteobacteria bacterium]
MDTRVPDVVEARAASLKDEAARRKSESQELDAAATTLTSLAKALRSGDLKRVQAALDKARASVPDGSAAITYVAEPFAQIETFLREEPQRIRDELGRGLKDACAAHGLSFRIVSREDPIEVRIPPFSVTLDFSKGRAVFRFARLEIGQCAASRDEILETHGELAKSFGPPFEAGKFFDQCRRAYLSAAIAEGRRDGDRLELAEFLPYLAIQRQSKAFCVSPESSAFKGYSRAQFAFDVMRLREAGGLSRNGFRLNLGVATGTSATDRSRSLYIEDAEGNGEYKISVFFTAELER